MKLIVDSLDTMIVELRVHEVTTVRVARGIQRERGPRASHGAGLTARIIVTARIDEHLWAEARSWVGSASEIAASGARVPDTLERRVATVRAEIVHRLEAAGVETLGGLIAHDTAAMDSFRV